MDSTQSKHISRIGSFPKVWVKTNNVWNHHPDKNLSQLNSPIYVSCQISTHFVGGLSQLGIASSGTAHGKVRGLRCPKVWKWRTSINSRKSWLENSKKRWIVFFWDGLFSGAFAVSFREGTQTRNLTVRPWKMMGKGRWSFPCGIR